MPCCVQVHEGAACWAVWRRWRELKVLTKALSDDYGRGTCCRPEPEHHLPSLSEHLLAGTPFNLPLPSVPRSVTTLHKRSTSSLEPLHGDDVAMSYDASSCNVCR